MNEGGMGPAGQLRDGVLMLRALSGEDRPPGRF